MDFRNEQATVDGAEISYRIGGQGPPLVLLHGWPQTSSAWDEVAPVLAAAGNTVVVPDLPGLGQSEPLPSGFTKDAQAVALRSLVRDIGTDGPLRIVGHDIGGMVAFSWCRLFPAEVERVVFVDFGMPGLGLEHAMDMAQGGRWHLGFFMTPEVPEMLIEGSEEEFFTWWFAKLASNHAAFPESRIAQVVEAYRGRERLRTSFGHYRALLDDIRTNQSWVSGGGKLSMPVAAIGGAQSLGDGLGRSLEPVVTDLRTVVVEAAGHFVAEEQPGVFVDHVLSFLAESR